MRAKSKRKGDRLEATQASKLSRQILSLLSQDQLEFKISQLSRMLFACFAVR